MAMSREQVDARSGNGKLRLEILKRDNSTCVCCGMFGSEMHHIESVSMCLTEGKSKDYINHFDNLATLCRTCHRHAPDGKNEFQKYKNEGGAATWYMIGRIYKKWSKGDFGTCEFKDIFDKIKEVTSIVRSLHSIGDTDEDLKLERTYS